MKLFQMTFTNDLYNQLRKLISLKLRAKTRQNTIYMSINRQTDKLRQKQTNLTKIHIIIHIYRVRLFIDGRMSLIKSISNNRHSNLLRHFLSTLKQPSTLAVSSPCSFMCWPITDPLCSSVRWCKCRHVYSRHNLRHTDHIEICTQCTVDSQEVASFLRFGILRRSFCSRKLVEFLYQRDYMHRLLSCLLNTSADFWLLNETSNRNTLSFSSRFTGALSVVV